MSVEIGPRSLVNAAKGFRVTKNFTQDIDNYSLVSNSKLTCFLLFSNLFFVGMTVVDLGKGPL